MKRRRFVKEVSFQGHKQHVRIHAPLLVRYLRHAPPAKVHLEDLGIKPMRFGF
ncbi:MAG: hypothetical protein WCS96_07925 [Victivallales bacterium]